MSLCILSEQLPFNAISQLELKRSHYFQTATETRELIRQNEHEFFATDYDTVCKFVKVNDKWSQDKEATVKDIIIKCLVLSDEILLVVMARHFSFFNAHLEHSHDVTLSSVIDGLSGIIIVSEGTNCNSTIVSRIKDMDKIKS